MKSLATRAALLIAAGSICVLSILKTQGRAEGIAPEIRYSTTGHGPSILLLHDSSRADQDWAEAARELAARFEVTLVDISSFIDDRQGVQRLRQAIQDLEIDDRHIAGSANGAELALRYALSNPRQSDSFVLPHNSADLAILADIINATPSTKS